MILINCAL
jgi:hypothetical protein